MDAVSAAMELDTVEALTLAIGSSFGESAKLDAALGALERRVFLNGDPEVLIKQSKDDA